MRDLATRGMHVLLEAALTYGAGCKQRHSAHARFFRDGFEVRLGDFFRRLGIPMRALTGSSPDYVVGLETMLGGQLPPVMRELRVMDEAAYFRLMVLASGALNNYRSSVLELDSVTDVETLFDTVKRVLEAHDALSTARRLASPFSATIFPTQEAPFATLIVAKAVLRAERGGNEVDALDVDALTTVGAFTLALYEVRQCALCFRWAVPGHRACFNHSLSVEVGGTAQERQCRYERGRRAAALIGLPAPNRHHLINGNRGLLYLVGRILWNTSIPCEERQSRYLTKLATEYPRAMAGAVALGSVAPSNVSEVLRRHVDPLEYRLGVWREKLAVADDWAQMEDALSVRGLGRRAGTTKKIDQALELALSGASRKEVALKLKVDPTVICQWHRRYAGDPKVSLLKALFGRQR